MKIEDKKQKRFHSTKNTQMAAGLSAIGIPFYKELPFQKTKYIDKREVITWHFEQNGNGYLTKDLIDWWYSDAWFKENYPKHPWALIISALLTKEYLVAKIKEEPAYIQVAKRNKYWYVHEGSDMHKKLSSK